MHLAIARMAAVSCSVAPAFLVSLTLPAVAQQQPTVAVPEMQLEMDSEAIAPTPAQLLGVQERSRSTASSPSVMLPAVEPSPVTEQPNAAYPLDRNTRVVMDPVYGTLPTADLPAYSRQGDNRFKLFMDLNLNN